MTAALEGSEWLAARPGRTLPPGKTLNVEYSEEEIDRFCRNVNTFVPDGVTSRPSRQHYAEAQP